MRSFHTGCLTAATGLCFLCCFTPLDTSAEPLVASRQAPWPPALELRRPALPSPKPGATPDHPIDALLQPYFEKHNLQPAAVVDDRLFARRAYLDITGLLPTPAELAQFQADQRPGKREQLAVQLLADKFRYAEHWLSFWSDALRNDYRGTGYIDGGRKQITAWLFESLVDNKPFDQFVRELISPNPDSEGFIKGIVWRGVVNASQVPPVQAAQNVSQVFMGINLKCASCHDSFINDWKLNDAYALAGVFSDGPLEIHRCDKPTGAFAPLKFLYPELGAVNGEAPRIERMRQLATLIASPNNGRLARTVVNRIWSRFFGRGIVSPVDEMDNAPWNSDLLDWLAADLVDHGYDLKHTMRRLVTSRAYQLPAMKPLEHEQDEFVFSGPLVRRMSAEQFIDGMATLTDTGYTNPGVRMSSLSRVPVRWIWNQKEAGQGTGGGRLFLRKVLDLPEAPTEARALIACDNQFTLYVNGQKVAAGSDWQKPALVDVGRQLVKGRNVLAVEAINWPDPATGSGLETKAPNPAGFVFHLRAVHKPSQNDGAVVVGNDSQASEVGSDATWTWSGSPTAGWEQPAFAAEGWQPAAEIVDADGGSWNLGRQLALMTLYGEQIPAMIRAALVPADPLLVALGRPNREQVVTDRPQAATTLQAVELTNGTSLATQIAQGAQKLAAAGLTPEALVDRIYLQAMGRKPSLEELASSLEIVGSPVAPAGIEDFLWIVAMLPEFQLIY